MVFPFYRRLSKKGKATYRKSDAVTEVRLRDPAAARPSARAIEVALGKGDRIEVERACHQLVAGMCRDLRTCPVSVRVLAARPKSDYGELHGLYVREEGKRPVLQVWMRTAAHERVVAFRTFLRTLLHEVGHHLDYELLQLEDSLHTEGFFRRESSLMRQLVPPRAKKQKPAAASGSPRPTGEGSGVRAQQLGLYGESSPRPTSSRGRKQRRPKEEPPADETATEGDQIELPWR